MGLFWDRLKKLEKKKWEDMTPYEREQAEEEAEQLELDLVDEDLTDYDEEE